MRLETRPPNIEGKGAITATDLVRNALRMRPERIIIGECRGAETLDMLQAMNTGHEGSLTTLHANTPRDAVARLETMIMMAGFELPLEGHAAADRQRRRPDRPGQPPAGRPAQDHAHHRSRGHGAGHDRHAGHLSLRARKASTRTAGRSATSRPPACGPTFMDRLEAAGVRLPSSAFREASHAGGLVVRPRILANDFPHSVMAL